MIKPSVIRRIFKNKHIILHVNPPQLECFDNFEAVGGKVWPASDILVKYLDGHSNFVKGKNILELGAGCGYVGLICALLQAKQVILTDMSVKQRRMEYDCEGVLIENVILPSNDIVIENCRINVEKNKHEAPNCEFIVKELMWGQGFIDHIDRLQCHIDTLDLIIGSDVTYHVSRNPLLFWTIAEILRRQNQPSSVDNNNDNSFIKKVNSTNNCRVILAHEDRLDISTKSALKAAYDVGLKHTELLSACCENGTKYHIWEFSLI